MEDRVLEKALAYMHELESRPKKNLNAEIIDRIYGEIPGLLPRLKQVC